MRNISLFLTLTVLVSCNSNDPTVPVGSTDGFELVTTILPEPNNKIDILFVIDNSGSMLDEQQSMATWAQDYLFGVLELQTGTLPDLHIGVTSTDLGAGPFAISGCDGNGDNGALQTQPQQTGCTGPSGAYISDIANPDGTRTRNYTGDLADAFACISLLGGEGCGYEQPLEAMKRALDGSNPQNDGFLRDDALLAVIIVSDEDDCSVVDNYMFDTTQSDIADPLGPLSSFRCFEFGVVCNEPDARVPGARTDCVASASQYMDDMQPYIDFLHTLKSDPNMIMVGGIFGDTEPVAVSLDPESNFPRLDPSCTGTVNGGMAMPGVRLAEFLAGFPGRNQFASICADDMAGPLQSVASLVGGVAAQSPCLLGAIADRDAEQSGVQPECRVYEVFDPGTSLEARTAIEPCDSGDSQGCYRIAADPQACSLTQTQLAIAPPATTGHVVVECRRP